MYASVAGGMHFLNREDLTLTPALGEAVAEAFQSETELPATLRRAVLDDGDVSLAILKAWGERAHSVMGYGVFGIVLGGEMLAIRLWRRWRPEVAPDGATGEGSRDEGARGREQGAGGRDEGAGSRGRGAWRMGVVVIALAVGEMFFLAWLAGLPPRGQVGVRLAADGVNPVELPAFLGTEWIGRRVEVSEVERAILPADTGYARKDYVAVADPARRVFLSVVLSGRDRSSIHRPELCVLGQGWTISAVTGHHFRGPGPGGTIPATVLHVRREAATARGRAAVPELIAYWFVGGDVVEPTYWRRLARDAWNRVAHARADRWAYVLLQTGAADGEAAALARMQAVLDPTLPVFQNGPAGQ